MSTQTLSIYKTENTELLFFLSIFFFYYSQFIHLADAPLSFSSQRKAVKEMMTKFLWLQYLEFLLSMFLRVKIEPYYNTMHS